VSWIQKLHETYDRCANLPQFSQGPLLPIYHIGQQAHIEVVLDGSAGLKSARVLVRDEQTTTIPVTEDSASRANDLAPHPLADKLQYCAEDYAEAKRGGNKKPGFQLYRAQLEKWCDSRFAHPKAEVVFKYVSSGALIDDLIEKQVLVADKKGKLLDAWNDKGPLPPLFKLLTAKQGRRDQGDALVRWKVELAGDKDSTTWDDPGLQQSWISFYSELAAESGNKHKSKRAEKPKCGLCMVTGCEEALGTKHPRGIRWPGDGAKLISSNDTEDFTFRGRFLDSAEACTVGVDASQKAHSALGWLIRRQGHVDKESGQVYVAWAVGGHEVPDPIENTWRLFGKRFATADSLSSYAGDAGQQYALKLKKLISGYRSTLTTSEQVVVLGLDSASPGRMAIIYYRELTGSEFLDRILAWHQDFAWPQDIDEAANFVGAPAPSDIAEAAFGRKKGLFLEVDRKLRKATVERLLPCIVDGQQIPRDLVESCFRRVCNRVALSDPAKRGRQRDQLWNKCLGIACALYKGWRKDEDYQMSLEEGRSTRDYLFGRLLALADHLEERALYLADESLDTNAARLMQRFADRPSSTWRTIELALRPSEARLRASRPQLLLGLRKQFDQVMTQFAPGDLASDNKLTAEFLLGFHCQRAALWNNSKALGVADSEATPEKGQV